MTLTAHRYYRVHRATILARAHRRYAAQAETRAAYRAAGYVCVGGVWRADRRR